MKRIIHYLLPVLALLTAFGFSAAAIEIKGEIKKAGNNKNVYLYEYVGNRLTVIDSTQLKKERFSFKTNKPLPRGFYRLGFSQEQSTVFVAGQESFEVQANAADWNNTIIEGSKENDLYARYNAYNQQIGQEAQQLQAQLNDPAQKETATQRLNTLTLERQQWHQKLVDENPGTFVAKVARFFCSGAGPKRFRGFLF